jgi:hypothetical protein
MLAEKADSLFDLDANLEAYAKARPGELPGPQADERVRAFDAFIAEQLKANDALLQTAIDARGATLRSRLELAFRYDLPQAGDFFTRHWQLTRRYLHIDFNPTVTFCETPDDFINARLERFHFSPALREQELARLKAEAEAQAKRGGGTFGVYISGPGAFLNGWRLNYGLDGQPRDLLKSHSGQVPRVLEIAIHEALGHGFMAEYSALGAERKAFGMQDWEYAKRFQFRDLDTSAQALMQYKLGRVWSVNRYLEEGWAMWASSTLTPALLGQPRAPRYTLTQVWEAVERFPVSSGYRALFRAILTDLFLEPFPEEYDEWLWAIRALQSVSMKLEFAAAFGQPLAYVLGLIMANRLEARLGLFSVPYAMLIAGNVTYDLAQLSLGDMSALVWEPRFNPDWRLAALSALAQSVPAPVTLESLTTAARSQLNLAVPREFEE